LFAFVARKKRQEKIPGEDPISHAGLQMAARRNASFSAFPGRGRKKWHRKDRTEILDFSGLEGRMVLLACSTASVKSPGPYTLALAGCFLKLCQDKTLHKKRTLSSQNKAWLGWYNF
jgi:hypothetical protein